MTETMGAADNGASLGLSPEQQTAAWHTPERLAVLQNPGHPQHALMKAERSALFSRLYDSPAEARQTAQGQPQDDGRPKAPGDGQTVPNQPAALSDYLPPVHVSVPDADPAALQAFAADLQAAGLPADFVQQAWAHGVDLWQRNGGREISEPQRQQAAAKAREHISSVMNGDEVLIEEVAASADEVLDRLSDHALGVLERSGLLYDPMFLLQAARAGRRMRGG
ncbi:MAG: hypothetical protein ACRC67_09500 [Inquilinus sp.]|uniref:hypothetical protein n=1 Tax=Inquilinus sp. TaxID=1932117 RepID=UPI003F384D42